MNHEVENSPIRGLHASWPGRLLEFELASGVALIDGMPHRRAVSPPINGLVGYARGTPYGSRLTSSSFSH